VLVKRLTKVKNKVGAKLIMRKSNCSITLALNWESLFKERKKARKKGEEKTSLTSPPHLMLNM
jgi:hypothetical protein